MGGLIVLRRSKFTGKCLLYFTDVERRHILCGRRSDRRRSRTTIAIPNDKGLVNRALLITSLRKFHEIGRRCFACYYSFTKFIKVVYVDCAVLNFAFNVSGKVQSNCNL